MNINFRIEHLIFAALPVVGSDSPILQAAVEVQLIRIVPDQVLHGAPFDAVPQLLGGAFQLAGESKAAHWGHQVAQAIYLGIAPPRAKSRRTTLTGDSSE